MSAGLRVEHAERSRLAADTTLTVLKRQDPRVLSVVRSASHVAVYELPNPASDHPQWQRMDVEGALFLVRRDATPAHRLIVINRKSPSNYVEDLVPGAMELEAAERMIMYKNAADAVRGIWFYEQGAADEILQLINNIVESPRTAPAPQNETPAAPAAAPAAPPPKKAPSKKAPPKEAPSSAASTPAEKKPSPQSRPIQNPPPPAAVYPNMPPGQPAAPPPTQQPPAPLQPPAASQPPHLQPHPPADPNSLARLFPGLALAPNAAGPPASGPLPHLTHPSASLPQQPPMHPHPPPPPPPVSHPHMPIHPAIHPAYQQAYMHNQYAYMQQQHQQHAAPQGYYPVQYAPPPPPLPPAANPPPPGIQQNGGAVIMSLLGQGKEAMANGGEKHPTPEKKTPRKQQVDVGKLGAAVAKAQNEGKLEISESATMSKSEFRAGIQKILTDQRLFNDAYDKYCKAKGGGKKGRGRNKVSNA